MKRCCPAPFPSPTVAASRVTQLAVDTGLGIQGLPVCGSIRHLKHNCQRCCRKRCRC